MLDGDDFGLSELHETIRSGERVLIRRVRPEDMALYPGFLDDVSAEDLRLRFFARIAELSAAEIDKLSHLDYRHEMAFVALDEDTGQMLGLVRLKDELDERTAEFAILVRSRLKGHGLAPRLRCLPQGSPRARPPARFGIPATAAASPAQRGIAPSSAIAISFVLTSAPPSSLR